MNIRESIARIIAPGLRSESEIRELVKEEVARAKMALPITANYDPKNEGYRRLTGANEQRRDLSALSQDRMFEIAYFMFDTSAMTRRLARLDKTFLFGEPVSVEATEDDAQEIIDTFWAKNKMVLDFPDLIMWLSLLGEQCWPVEINPSNGEVRLLYVDPANIAEVQIHPVNVKQTVRVDLRGAAGRTGKKLSIVRMDEDPLSRTSGRMVGECFFYSINHPPNSPRGRSDFLTLFDWIDGLERYGFNYLERAEFLLNFVWDVTLKGMDENQIRDWLSKNPAPEPGSIRAHNEQVEWEAVSPDIKASDFTGGFDMGKSFIMGAAGRPDSWFGGGGKAYQTEADQFGQVPIKDFDERQLLIKQIVDDLIRFILDQAVIAGRLSAEKADAGFTVNMPEISKRDFAKLINGVPQFTTGLTLAEDKKWVSHETAVKLFALVAGQMGMDIDAAAELEAAGLPAADGTEDYTPQNVDLVAGDATLAQISLNGAQIASVLKLVQSVAAGTLPRESALNMIITAFPINREAAENILGAAGQGFKILPTQVE